MDNPFSASHREVGPHAQTSGWRQLSHGCKIHQNREGLERTYRALDQQGETIDCPDSLESWLRECLLTLLTQWDTTKAINYMLFRWQALMYYCEDGMVEIGNNIAENALRGCCLGRKNFDNRSKTCTTVFIPVPSDLVNPRFPNHPCNTLDVLHVAS